MFYKALGFVVWQGLKWYVGRRSPRPPGAASRGLVARRDRLAGTSSAWGPSATTATRQPLTAEPSGGGATVPPRWSPRTRRTTTRRASSTYGRVPPRAGWSTPKPWSTRCGAVAAMASERDGARAAACDAGDALAVREQLAARVAAESERRRGDRGAAGPARGATRTRGRARRPRRGAGRSPASSRSPRAPPARRSSATRRRVCRRRPRRGRAHTEWRRSRRR